MFFFGKWSGKMGGFYGWVDWICINKPIYWWRNHAYQKETNYKLLNCRGIWVLP
jgi:hypothetical protein